jgi:hypothetical protein
VLDPGRGRTKTGQLWAYARDDRPWAGADPPAVAYVYAPDRKAERPIAHLAGFKGVLQVDGYGGYRVLAERGGVTLAFCWSHVRRRFYELATAGPAPIASEALERIAGLYRIESDIRARNADERRADRRERSRPIIEAFEPWLREKLGLISQKTKLAEAIRYTLSRWEGLTRFLDDGRIEIDSNVVERAIRPIAMMRSLCTPLSSVCKHCKLVFRRGATRARCSPDRGGHPFMLQVRGSDLVRRARHNLLGGKKAVLDEPTDAVARDSKRGRGLGHRQPFADLLGRTVGADAVHPPQRADAVRRPGLSLTSGHSHSVQRRGDVCVRPSGRHAPHHGERLFGGAAAVLAGLRLADPQL